MHICFLNNTKIIQRSCFISNLTCFIVSIAKTSLPKYFMGKAVKHLSGLSNFALKCRRRELLYLISLPQPFGFLPCFMHLVPFFLFCILPYPFLPSLQISSISKVLSTLRIIVSFHVHNLQNIMFSTCNIHLVMENTNEII